MLHMSVGFEKSWKLLVAKNMVLNYIFTGVIWMETADFLCACFVYFLNMKYEDSILSRGVDVQKPPFWLIDV